MKAKSEPGFFTELRRRRVLPVAGAYIAIAWLATEIASFLLKQASAPGWTLRLLAIVFLVGFPVTVFLAWVIQMQPDGKWSVDSSSGQHKIVIGAIGLGILATVGFSWIILPGIEDRPDVPGYQPLANSLAILPLQAATGTPSEKAMANTLFNALASGLDQSEKLHLFDMSKLDERPDDLVTFGRGFRATALLTGQIFQSRQGIQIRMKLLDVVDDVEIWSQTIDLDPTQIIKTGTDIANEVLRSMGLPLMSPQNFTGTQNRYAYEALLRGLENQNSFNIDEMRIAMDDFERAIDLDPAYVRAYVGLAQTIFVYLNMKGPSEKERQNLLERQRELVETAYRLDENNTETTSLMGMLADDHELKVQMYERALVLDPNHGHNYFRLGHVRLDEGNFEEAERLFRRALEFNPRSANYHSDLGSALWHQGRHDEARSEINYSIELDAKMVQNYQKLATWNMFYYGRIDEAIINLRKAYALDPEVGYTASGIATNYRHLSMEKEAKAWINRALEVSPTAAWVYVLAAYVYKSFGDEEAAITHYRRSLELAPSLAIPLRELASWDIRQGHWETARERWRGAYPELVSSSDPKVNQGNLDIALWFAMNLKEAGLEAEALRLLEKCRAVASELSPESDAASYQVMISDIIEPNLNRAQVLKELRLQLIDNRQRAELDFSASDFDFLRDDPEFQELVQTVQDDLARQRQRIQQMERNGEMPSAPGVNLSDP